ncbi:MAG TPA: hypothetical protein VFX49_10765, partial [Chloroflexota bacterium]|nr:hypothetical protein [Chloroflexota bacterium]
PRAASASVSPHYLTHPDRRPGRYVARWNLVVPPEFLAASWDEREGEFGAGLGAADGAAGARDSTQIPV